jgi:hypothetical protein
MPISLNILLIEDDSIEMKFNRVLKTLRMNHSVEANNGEEALEVLKRSDSRHYSSRLKHA